MTITKNNVLPILLVIVVGVASAIYVANLLLERREQKLLAAATADA